jgi:hypothetical protein
MTTPKSNPSKHHKHFRKAVAYCFRKLELCRHCRFWAGSFSGLPPGFRFWHICHVDRHGHLVIKQLRLPVLNETHTNIYTGPRLHWITCHSTTNNINFSKQTLRQCLKQTYCRFTTSSNLLCLWYFDCLVAPFIKIFFIFYAAFRGDN